MSGAGKQQERCPKRFIDYGTHDHAERCGKRAGHEGPCGRATPPEAATPGSLTRPAVHVTAPPKPSIEEIAKNLRVRGGTLEDFKKACEVAPEAATLNAALDNARTHVMTDEEKEAQRQSWVRGEQAMGEGKEAAKPTVDTIRTEAANAIANRLGNWRLGRVRDYLELRIKDDPLGTPTEMELALWHELLETWPASPSPAPEAVHALDCPAGLSGSNAPCNCVVSSSPQATQVGPDYTSSFTGETVRFFAPQGEPQPEQRIQELERLAEILEATKKCSMSGSCQILISEAREIVAVLKQSGGRG